MPSHNSSTMGDCVTAGIYFGQRVTRVLKVAFPVRGKPQATRRAREQACTELSF